ncbi:MAG: acetate/propionate family kinase [Steroidobacteraceae bacterium]
MSGAGSLVLALNAGSSSLKSALFRIGEHEEPQVLARAEVTRLDAEPQLRRYDSNGQLLSEQRWPQRVNARTESFLPDILTALDRSHPDEALSAVGHRVVHGGERFHGPVRVDTEVLQALHELVPLAPLHQPHNVALIQAMSALQPQLPQVACFDTAFHHTLPPNIASYALPESIRSLGVRRYGFHGLSYEYIAQALPRVAPDIARGRVIVAHLGAGASLCALQAGRSVDTTMGFTPLDGLPMSTRCGALDPGALLYLQRRGWSATTLENLLYQHSGLLGLSGISGDMRTLLASNEPAARMAVEVFVLRVAREIGALSVSLGGFDALVFTGGIGENAPVIRARICEPLRWLGMDLDPQSNDAGELRLSQATSRISVWRIPTDEDWIVARHTWRTVFNDQGLDAPGRRAAT